MTNQGHDLLIIWELTGTDVFQRAISMMSLLKPTLCVKTVHHLAARATENLRHENNDQKCSLRV